MGRQPRTVPGSQLERSGSQEGAVAVITALTLTVLLLMAAFAIDLGFLRADRVQSKSVSDMAAAAAVVDYRPGENGSALAACREAIAFAAANIGSAAVEVPGQTCAAIYPPNYACDNSVAPDPPARAEIGGFLVEVLIPVPDDHPLMGQQPLVADFDLQGCDRVGISIERDRQFLLAGVAGFGGATTRQGSVANSFIDGELKEFASLVVLERSGCQVLTGGGGGGGEGGIRVLTLVRDEVQPDGSVEEAIYPGTITVDTLPAGQCVGGGSQKLIQVAGGSLVRAEGEIFAHSMQVVDPDGTDSTFSPADVEAGRLDPAPTAGPLISRTVVDHSYNCLTEGDGGYPGSAPPPWSPAAGGQPIGPCPTPEVGSAPPPYLKNLDDIVLAAMNSFTDTGAAAGWSVFPDDHAAESCTSSGQAVSGGQWIVDCPTTFGPDDLTFNGVDHIIFRNGLAVGTGDQLRIYGNPGVGTTVTLFDGRLERGGGILEMRDVFVYLRNLSPASNQDRVNINVSGSAGTFAFQGVLDDAGCAGYSGGLPPAACFSPIALWSNYASDNSNQYNRLAGNASGGVIGTVFTPSALFRFEADGEFKPGLCGNVDWVDITSTDASLQLEGAQFFVESISVQGGAEIGMCPSPDTTIDFELRGSGLIR